MQYALKYIASCWDADLVSNIIGAPGQPRRTGGPSSPENVTLLAIILPDPTEARKPALSSVSTIKQALAALTSLIQVGSAAFACASCFFAPLICQPTQQGATIYRLPKFLLKFSCHCLCATVPPLLLIDAQPIGCSSCHIDLLRVYQHLTNKRPLLTVQFLTAPEILVSPVRTAVLYQDSDACDP